MLPAEVFKEYQKELGNMLTPIWHPFLLKLNETFPELNDNPQILQNGAALFLSHVIEPNVDENLRKLCEVMELYDGDRKGPVSKLGHDIIRRLESVSKSTGTCKDEDSKSSGSPPPPPPSSGIATSDENSKSRSPSPSSNGAATSVKQIDYRMVEWKKFLFRIEDRVHHDCTNGFGFFGRLKLSDKSSDVLVTTYHLFNDKKVVETSTILLEINDRSVAVIELKDVLRKDYSFWQSQEDKLNFTIVEIDMSKIKERLEEQEVTVVIEPLDLDPNNLTSIDKLDEIGIIEQSNCLYFKSASCCVCEHLLVYSRHRTKDGYSGSPILKVVNGEIKIVGIAQGNLTGEVYVGSIISDVLKSVQGKSDDKKPSIDEIKQHCDKTGMNWKWTRIEHQYKML